MWRAFFFSVGTILFILGLQCLVVDKFYVNQNGRVSDLVNKALNVIDSSGTSGANQPNSMVAGQNRATLPNTGTSSAYGPSRFQTAPYSPAQFNSNNPANYGGQGFQSAGFPQPTTGSGNVAVKPSRPLKTEDWMPWSLLAVGTIIVLYTKSTGNLIISSTE